MPEQNNASNPKSELFGTALGFAAFLIWGLFPLYFVLLKDVPPLVTLAFRAVFTTVVLFPIVLLRGKGTQILRTLRKPWLVAGMFVTMATTAASWGLFIWLVAVNHTLYASLGNYASPLVSVAFGALVFRERPSVLAWISITLAAIAVVVFAAGVGRLPWESVVVAFVFAIYSVLRKKMGVDSTTALSVETLFAFPIGAAYIVYKIRAPETAPFWATDAYFLWLLIGAGALTAIPLLLFGSAAVRIKLSTLGLLNYLCPTGQFLCGVFVLGEKTSAFQWVSFVLIWIALTFFTVDLFRNEKLARQPIQHANA
ncbi:MAG: EamA family transporter RarD [Thermoguttaceae bacterium]|nr:EamA family transporter RarD [Thermoguttaceae bacterium]